MLTELDYLPDGLLQVEARELYTILPGPTLIHLPGRRDIPLFVSILLHGNEDTGLKAMQTVLKKYQNTSLPRALSLFIGNIEAARQGVRRLENQLDYNRVWSADADANAAEHRMTRKVVKIMMQRGVFASIDIHNNSGLNPHYACINRLDDTFLHLATMFSRIVVYFTNPKGVQSEAFAHLCPAVTLECGKPGGIGGIEHAATFVEGALHLSSFPAHPVPKHDLSLFHSVAVVTVPEAISLSVGASLSNLCLEENIDHYNFRELEPGTRLGFVSDTNLMPLRALNETGQDISGYYFEVKAGELIIRRPVMPAMLTRDILIIRQDCLCYLMERLELKLISPL
ncbi:MAG: M14 family metallopeptidase [Nitrosomonas sp.]|uniref:M14 family metallopeptidase n=1 Tax=Nitrosomonas sp. TaxID=42353 RepID=UPI00273422C7|nr:M14 family metallopeptidase [Nitrosomonas sp.]MDP3281786.1 M14 family metallopeptidase [Nitrosomonas sp.]MDP3664928.1 M14 family metallopeptidase [Nitrosomonas sp.]MDZ4107245.1 M14 family metallopeptidase [Nitrosomonas sp.]